MTAWITSLSSPSTIDIGKRLLIMVSSVKRPLQAGFPFACGGWNVLRKIGEGLGLSELTTHVADPWGLSRKQARRYVSEANAEFLNDYEVEDSGLLFACIDKLERVARISMEKGRYSNTIGAIKLLNEMLRLGADQKSMRAPVGYGQGWRR